jgi:predicted phosphodiesterase
MRIAVISDIHGNALALEAVLADIERHKPDAILNLGDHIVGPLDPKRTAEMLAAVDAISILGNTDRYIIEANLDDLEPDERWIVDQLPADTMDWLRSLPATARFEDQIFMSHGAPDSDEIYWLDRPKGNVFRTSTIAEIEAELPDAYLPLYCCGHTHVARIVALSDGRKVFNPGSVGRPSFNMSDPDSASRAGPEAAYALLTRSGNDWSIDLRQIPYDHKAAAALARTNGNPGWEQDLLHGRRR